MASIAELRAERGWTLEQLAERVGADRTTVWKLENGKRRMTVDWLRRFATALGVLPEALIADSAPADDGHTRITLRIPRAVHAHVAQEAAGRSHSMNAEIVRRLSVTVGEDLSTRPYEPRTTTINVIVGPREDGQPYQRADRLTLSPAYREVFCAALSGLCASAAFHGDFWEADPADAVEFAERVANLATAPDAAPTTDGGA